MRDNVYLTAGLHGMTRREIDQRFDEIIEFAELQDFVDTPYKHLSSGMKVRIAFAVVSRLEEPIMLVDEVLAVGDKGFREKCYTRIEELLAGGRTLFFVSHNERDLLRFCHARSLPRQGLARARRPDQGRASTATTPTTASPSGGMRRGWPWLG